MSWANGLNSTARNELLHAQDVGLCSKAIHRESEDRNAHIARARVISNACVGKLIPIGAAGASDAPARIARSNSWPHHGRLKRARAFTAQEPANILGPEG